MAAERTWSDIFASGAAAPALVVGISTEYWTALLARLLGDAPERRVLVIAASLREQRFVRERLPSPLHRLVVVTTEGRFEESRRGLAVDVVLWLGLVGRFDAASGAFNDACSAHERRLIERFLGHSAPRLNEMTLYVATRNPAHAVLPNCLVPERMAAMDADLRAAVAVQFNAPDRPAVVSAALGLQCAQDGAAALLRAADAVRPPKRTSSHLATMTSVESLFATRGLERIFGMALRDVIRCARYGQTADTQPLTEFVRKFLDGLQPAGHAALAERLGAAGIPAVQALDDDGALAILTAAPELLVVWEALERK